MVAYVWIIPKWSFADGFVVLPWSASAYDDVSLGESVLTEFASPPWVTGTCVVHCADAMPARPGAGEDLTVVAAVAVDAPTLVHTFALATVQARDDTFGKLAPQPVKPFAALARVFLHAFPTVLALLRANSAFAVVAVKSRRTRAGPWSCARAVVHTLGIAQRICAILPQVTLLALANFVVITISTIGTFFITLRIWPPVSAFFSQIQPQRRSNQWLTILPFNRQTYAETCNSGIFP